MWQTSPEHVLEAEPDAELCIGAADAGVGVECVSSRGRGSEQG
jgi:hypothetical protein